MSVFPTRTEQMWQELKELQERITVNFIDGVDTEAVFKARLYGLGLRGDVLKTEINLAKMVKHEKELEDFNKKTEGAFSHIIHGI
jgi:hypothetical protein